MGIKEIIRNHEKNNRMTQSCVNAVRYIHTEIKKVKLCPGEFYRGLGLRQDSFVPLRELKNRYAGERCFIIATGPSLREEDVLALKNEYTFGMNSVCKLFEKIAWQPTFFGIQDLYVYDNLMEKIQLATDTIVFIGDNIARKRAIDEKWIRFPLNAAYNEYAQYVKGEFPVRFSDDCYKVVYDGYSITFSLLQIAVYLGFKEIYLLGADCSFSSKGNNHFAEHGHVDARIESAQARNFSMYECAKAYCNKRGVSIYNSTRGGELEIFPRVDFDSIIKK